jgi:hypothetical protein
LPLALPVFCGLAEPRFVELIPRYLASFGEPPPQRFTGVGGTRNKPLLLVGDVAFDEAHNFASTNHPRFLAKLCFLGWL